MDPRRHLRPAPPARRALRTLRASSAGSLLVAAAGPADHPAVGPVRTSPWAWGVAALLVLAALYLAIRMVEWDLMNEDTPNQEDPFSE